MTYGERFDDALIYASHVHGGQLPQRNRYPVHHPPPRGRLHRGRERRDGRRSNRRPAARRPRRPGRRGTAAGHPRPVRRPGGGDSSRLHGHLRRPEAAVARRKEALPGPPRRDLRAPSASSPRPTSCTTPAPSSPTTAHSARTSGPASTARRTVRSGTTGRWSRPTRGRERPNRARTGPGGDRAGAPRRCSEGGEKRA